MNASEEFLKFVSGPGLRRSATYTTGVLRSWRSLARVTAVVLLAWTAVDLGFPECCVSEQLELGATAPTISAHDRADAARIDVDDCFCCALCIDTGWRIPTLSVDTARPSYRDPIRHLATRVVALDHPPQNA